MNIIGLFRAAGVSAAFSLCVLALPAAASTLWEADVAGGEFSADYRSPTVVGADVTAISGVGGNSSDDYFMFTGLEAGELTLSFAAPAGVDYSYSAGGVVLWDTSPFDYEWDGTRLSTSLQIDYYTRGQSLTLTLPKDFLGTLYLALNFTHGEGLTYNINDFRTEAGLRPVETGKTGGAADDMNMGKGVDSATLGGEPSAALGGAVVPLPAPLLLLGSSLVGLGLLRRNAWRRPA